ncbi:MAG: protein translocase subunit SecD [Phycisphaerales bacterium]|nr:protein translocase subunit SecD [Phycisphaerales bacterium]
MNEDRKVWHWAMVVVPVVAAAIAIYPPHRKLKAGIDLAGGTSMLFEIDTSGMSADEKDGLANNVMEVLKRRIDPNGQLNLVWRPVGQNRIEIQMPRPPREALLRREAFEAAIAQVRALNITRPEIEDWLHLPAEERTTAKDKLVHGVPERNAKLDALVTAYDAYGAAKDDVAAAQSSYESALQAVLSTSVDLSQLSFVLDLTEPERSKELERIRGAHTSEAYGTTLAATDAAHRQWAEHKGVLEDPSDLKRRIRGAGVLEFRILAERDSGTPTHTAHKQVRLKESIAKYTDQLQQRGPRRHGGDAYMWLPVADILDLTNADTHEVLERTKHALPGGLIVEKYAGQWFVLSHAEKEHGLTRDSAQKWKLVNAYRGMDPQTGRPTVNFQLDARGGRQFGKLTGDNLNRQLSILLDGVAQSTANIESMIRESGMIRSSKFTQEQVGEYVTTLRAGALPARLIETPLMERTVGPSLGEHNRAMGMRAAIVGLVAVMVAVAIYYYLLGMVANVALALNLLFTLAIMATMQATFTLPGIAGLVLGVAMAIDANVLIFERMREETDRGATLKRALRLGYDRALAPIVDSNLTTLLTCVVLGYLGTEEVKGFAMTLGFGLVTSMFTALFVTRVIFTALIGAGVLKQVRMMRLVKPLKVDWVGLRRVFWPASLASAVACVVFTGYVATTNKEALFDIELLGGTSVQIELKAGETVTDEQMRRLIASTSGEPKSAVQWLEEAADALAACTVSRGDKPSSFAVHSTTLTADQIESLCRSELETKLERGGFTRSGQTLKLEARAGGEGQLLLDEAGLKSALERAAANAREAALRLASAKVQTVEVSGGAEGGAMAFEVITVETRKDLVQAAILGAMSPEAAAASPLVPELNVERSVSFEVATDAERAPEGCWPIQAEDRYLADVLGDASLQFDIHPYKGGVAIVVDKLDPPLTAEAFERRIREIRLHPEFSQFEMRQYRAIGLTRVGEENKLPTFNKFAYVAVDENLPYYDDPTGSWDEQVAQTELTQVREALGTEKSVRKVNQFAPQVAARTQQQAIIAVIVSLAAIVAYIWIRFGNVQFGLAAIVALVFDVCIPLGLVTASHYVYRSFVGRALLLEDFKIDLSMIAAFLTIIGYSINDKIVVFDRIRENRGKLKSLNAAMLNAGINQTFPRTILTGMTTLIALSTMYLFGGTGIHGFAFAMLLGVVGGTYSSITIAVPLVHRPRVLHTIVYLLVAGSVFGIFWVMVSASSVGSTLLPVGGLVILAGLIWAIVMELRKGEHRMTMPGVA